MRSSSRPALMIALYFNRILVPSFLGSDDLGPLLDGPILV